MSIIVVPRDFPTIQAAVIAAQPGDLVFVKKGTYHESVEVVGKNNIAIIAENRKVILDGENQLPHGFRVGSETPFPAGQPSTNIEIKGFTIQNYLQYGIVEETANNTYYINNRIRNIGIDGIAYTLIFSFFLEGNRVIWKNKISKIGQNGVNVNFGMPTTIVIQNVIDRVGNNGINISGPQFVFQNNISHSENNGINIDLSVSGVLTQNKISESGNDGILFSSSTGPVLLENIVLSSKNNGITNNSIQNLISMNTTKNNNGNGIELISGDGFNFIEENSTSKNKEDGIQVNQNNNFIVRNTAIENDDDGIDLNSNNNEVVENFACDNGDKDIENNGLNNQFFKNRVCDDSIGHDDHDDESSDESSS